MPEISAARVRELAQIALDRWACSDDKGEHPPLLELAEAAVRLGSREGLERAAEHCEYHYAHLASFYRAIRIEGEEKE